MDLSDILFYIVIGAIGIFSYISQQKAKKQAEEIERRKQQQSAQDNVQEISILHEKDYEKHTTENQQEPTLDDIFRALRERRPIPVAQKQKEISLTTSTSVDPVVKPIINLPQEEGQRAISEELTRHAITDENIYDNDLPEQENTQEIDWRQAVISAEILNRKY